MLDYLFPSRKSASAMGDNDAWLHWLESAAPKTKAGVYVNEDNALTLAACWCATRVISETIAALPLILYERDRGDGRYPATEHPLYDLLKVAPNPEMGSMAWREGRLHHQVNYGNAFSEIQWDSMQPERRTRVLGLHPIHPSRVQPVTEGGSPKEYAEGYRYRINNDDGSQVVMKADEMLHVPGPISEDGIWGKGVIQYARETIGSAMSAEQHAASSFGDNNMPGAVVVLPGMKDPNVRKQFRKEWREVHSGPNGDKLAILPPEGEFHALGALNNEDLQWIQSRQFSVSQVARFYRLPPHVLADLTRSSFANIESETLSLVVFSLMPWIRRWEEQINLKCLLPRERRKYYCEHLLAGLLRGDIKSRFDAYRTGIQTSILTPNEARRMENLNPMPGGDRLLAAMNLTYLDRLGEQAEPVQQSQGEIDTALEGMAQEVSL